VEPDHNARPNKSLGKKKHYTKYSHDDDVIDEQDDVMDEPQDDMNSRHDHQRDFDQYGDENISHTSPYDAFDDGASKSHSSHLSSYCNHGSDNSNHRQEFNDGFDVEDDGDSFAVSTSRKSSHSRQSYHNSPQQVDEFVTPRSPKSHYSRNSRLRQGRYDDGEEEDEENYESLSPQHSRSRQARYSDGGGDDYPPSPQHSRLRQARYNDVAGDDYDPPSPQRRDVDDQENYAVSYDDDNYDDNYEQNNDEDNYDQDDYERRSNTDQDNYDYDHQETYNDYDNEDVVSPKHQQQASVHSQRSHHSRHYYDDEDDYHEGNPNELQYSPQSHRSRAFLSQYNSTQDTNSYSRGEKKELENDFASPQSQFSQGDVNDPYQGEEEDHNMIPDQYSLDDEILHHVAVNDNNDEDEFDIDALSKQTFSETEHDDEPEADVDFDTATPSLPKLSFTNSTMSSLGISPLSSPTHPQTPLGGAVSATT